MLSLVLSRLTQVIVQNWQELTLRWLQVALIVVITGMQIFNLAANPIDGVSVSCHVGGGCSGVFFGVICLRNEIWHKWERVVLLAGVVCALVVLAVSIVHNATDCCYIGTPDAVCLG